MVRTIRFIIYECIYFRKSYCLFMSLNCISAFRFVLAYRNNWSHFHSVSLSLWISSHVVKWVVCHVGGTCSAHHIIYINCTCDAILKSCLVGLLLYRNCLWTIPDSFLIGQRNNYPTIKANHSLVFRSVVLDFCFHSCLWHSLCSGWYWWLHLHYICYSSCSSGKNT